MLWDFSPLSSSSENFWHSVAQNITLHQNNFEMFSSPIDSLLRTAQQYHQAGKLREAEQTYRQVLQHQPNHPRALFMLGAISHQAGNIPAALDWLAKAEKADPTFAETSFLIGVVHHQRGELDATTVYYRKAVSLQSNHIRALNNLGRVLLDAGQITEGTELLRKVLALAPQHASAHSNLGDALRLTRDFDAAIAAYQRAIAIQPNLAEAHGNLGAALAEKGQPTQGIASLNRAISINPKLSSAHYNLAKALQETNQFDEAIRHCQLFIELRPDYADGHNLLGSLLGISGKMPEAIESQRRAIALKPNQHGSASNLLLSFHYLQDVDPPAIFQAHLDWATRYANPLSPTIAPHPNDRDPNRKLRIGYISPNFNQHSVAYFLESVLAAHDRSAVEIFCYADLIRPDAVTTRFQALADHWREITGLSDAAVAEKIRNDSIDVLIDLAGHTADNRMIVFAMKPALVQFTWLGYPDTTGLSTIEYRITDTIADPPGRTETLHTEKLVRLEGGCWAYTPPADAPAVGPLPALANGFITFGSFNNLPKVTPKVIQTWANILMAAPDSRLLIKAMGLTGKAGQDYIRKQITRHGVDHARLDLLGWMPRTSSHLELYNRVDIALDPFPYNGTTTTVEAIWMGVPVVALAGQTHTSRVGVSMLTHVGLTDWIAGNPDEYVNLAKAKAADIVALSQLRNNLRWQLQSSQICDGSRLARQLESAYRAGWIHWLASSR
jgi:protein O-GlcNAc transferase